MADLKLDEESERVAQWLQVRTEDEKRLFFNRVKTCEDRLREIYQSPDGLNTQKLIQTVMVFQLSDLQRLYLIHKFTLQFFGTAHLSNILKQAGNDDRK